MPTSRLTISGDVGGAPMSGTITKQATAAIREDPTIAAAKSGTLSTRTNNTEGTLTLGAGHGITDAQVIDVYWSGGYRYGVTVGTVATNDVPISGGAGDNLPDEDTPITCMVQDEYECVFDGDDLVSLGMSMNPAARGHVGFYTDVPGLIAEYEITSGEPLTPAIADFAGETVATYKVTQAGTAASTTLNLGVLHNAAP